MVEPAQLRDWMNQPPAVALMAPALEQQGGGGLGDDSLEVGNFFSIEAVIYGSEFFLGPLNGSLDRILVDFSLSKGAVGEDYDLGIGDLGKAGADGEGLGEPPFPLPRPALQCILRLR